MKMQVVHKMSEADYLPYQINTRTKDIIGLSKEVLHLLACPACD